MWRTMFSRTLWDIELAAKEVQRIADKAFLITPYNVEVESGDFLYEIENGLN
jgi:hypothetical protein